MKYNQQIPMKPEHSDGQKVNLHSIFNTFQGEGPFTGYPAIFIRLMGCNLQCPGCDTEYSGGATWYAESLARFARAMTELEDPLVVITGGEPFRQNISPLCWALLKNGFIVQVETNGTLPPSHNLPKSVHIVCSPKTGRVNKVLEERINCYKYVARDGEICADDGLPETALGHSAVPRLARPRKGFKGRVYLQPMDEQDENANKANLDAVIRSCQGHGHILQLQTHKIIGVD